MSDLSWNPLFGMPCLHWCSSSRAIQGLRQPYGTIGSDQTASVCSDCLRSPWGTVSERRGASSPCGQSGLERFQRRRSSLIAFASPQRRVSRRDGYAVQLDDRWLNEKSLAFRQCANCPPGTAPPAIYCQRGSAHASSGKHSIAQTRSCDTYTEILPEAG